MMVGFFGTGSLSFTSKMISAFCTDSTPLPSSWTTTET